MTSRPTPADLAKADDARRQLESPQGIFQLFIRDHSEIDRLLTSCGLSAVEQLARWLNAESADVVLHWIQTDSAPQSVVSAWRDSLPHSQPCLLAALMKEWQLSARMGELGPYFRQFRLTYSNSLRHARLGVGYQLLNAARDLSLEDSADREYYVRLLELAASYIGTIVAGDRLDGKPPSAELLGRFGVAVVLRGRFRRPRVAELRGACAALEESIAGGNTHEAAYEYYLEGLTQLYDVTAEREVLSKAASFVRELGAGPGTAQWHMNSAEVWMKLVELATPVARRGFMSNALDSLQSAQQRRDYVPMRVLRLKMMLALANSMTEQISTGRAVDCRGLAFPFGVRTRTSRLPGSVLFATEAILETLRAAADAGDYLPREVSADLLAYRGRQGGEQDRIRDLTSATQRRQGASWQNPLRGERVELAQAEDLLELATLNRNELARHSAFNELIGHWRKWPSSAAALAVIALDLEHNGGLVSGGTFSTATAGPSPRMLALVTAIHAGNFSTVYALAAAVADSSPHAARRGLGGRSQVVAVDDSFGAGQTFVFKPMSRNSSLFDETQGRSIAERIRDTGQEALYGVIEHLAIVDANTLGLTLPDRYEVIGVQKYVDSSSLLEYALGGGESTTAVLSRTARFLGLIHSLDAATTIPVGCRRQTREQDVRYWLRRITPKSDEEANALFDDWWSLVGSTCHYFRRRDAHVQNWLVDGNGRIIALDLDCNGWRPLGYEIAQLTDDHALLDPDDWDSRVSILRAYLDELAANGIVCAFDEAERAYQAGLIARVVRTFSLAESIESEQVHATRLLQWLAVNSSTAAVKRVAAQILEAWGVLSGLGIEDRIEMLKTPERRRISRAMAYHLRHDSDAPLSRDGWIHVDELTAKLTAGGHRVTSKQLLVIAGAMGEPRFQISERDIRAVYGHSIPLAIDYESPEPPSELFHGTAASNLESVAEARDGLRRMSRQFVHLTSSKLTAVRAAERRQESTVVLRIAPDAVSDLRQASDETWLAPRVPVSAATVVPLWELAASPELNEEQN